MVQFNGAVYGASSSQLRDVRLDQGSATASVADKSVRGGTVCSVRRVTNLFSGVGGPEPE